MAKQQKALLLSEPGPAGKFIVESRDVPSPGPGFILVKVHATGLNPADWFVRDTGTFVAEWPAIIGSDAAGITVEVGEGVENVAVGDRVMYAGTIAQPQVWTFQQYNLVRPEFVAKIPNSMSFEEAATIPLTMQTAAMGLYDKRQQPGGGLALTPPWVVGGRGKYAGEPIVIAGGATGVGQHVIRFAKASGFSPIVVTASLHNEEYLKSVGATHVVDRNLPQDALEAAVRAVTEKAVRFAYDAVLDPDVQKALYDLLAPGGCFVRVGPNELEEAKLVKGDKYVAHAF